MSERHFALRTVALAPSNGAASEKLAGRHQEDTAMRPGGNNRVNTFVAGPIPALAARIEGLVPSRQTQRCRPATGWQVPGMSRRGNRPKGGSTVFALRAACAAGALFLGGTAMAQDVGLVNGSFRASYVPASGSCTSLLVTGQFQAPTPGYTLSVKPAATQPGPTVYALELTATPPTGPVTQVLTLMPVEYADPKFSACPYGVSIAYGKQRVLVGLTPASIAIDR
jgi:hypothetical protein